MEFIGCFTAIVTPFKGTGVDNPIDWEGYRRLLELQDEGGIEGIVACGTTGESPTLSHEEHNKIIEFTVENSKGAVIAGTGSNSTWEAVEMSKHAAEVGAHATLQVCPYYNKPSQEGLFRHFGAVAEAVDIPMILYNIPGRASKEIAPETMARLAGEYSNVIGVKEASGKEEVWKDIRDLCRKDFLILSGNDSDTYRLMKDYNAKGVVSVASNLVPELIVEFVGLGLEEKFSAMEKENARLRELFDAFFIETNPIPVKEAMNMVNMPGGGYRLPMCEMGRENKAKLEDILKKFDILQV